MCSETLTCFKSLPKERPFIPSSPYPSLLPCPFCGSDAYFHDQSGTMKTWPAALILCRNEECPCQMRLTYDEMGGAEFSDFIPKLAEKWNTRVTIHENVSSN